MLRRGEQLQQPHHHQQLLLHDITILGVFVHLANRAFMLRLQLRFDGHSTTYQRSLRSQWRNPLAAVTLTYLFI